MGKGKVCMAPSYIDDTIYFKHSLEVYLKFGPLSENTLPPLPPPPTHSSVAVGLPVNSESIVIFTCYHRFSAICFIYQIDLM